MSRLSKCSIGPAFVTMSGGCEDRPRVHQGGGKRVAARLDGAGKRLPQDLQRPRRAPLRKDTDGQPLAPARDPHLERAALAREPRQRPRLREGSLDPAAVDMSRLGEHEGAEGPGRQEDHLAVGEMRRQRHRDVCLGEGGHGAEDQVCAPHGLGHGRRDERELRAALAAEVLDQDGPALPAMLLDGAGAAAPQPHLVAGERKVAPAANEPLPPPRTAIFTAARSPLSRRSGPLSSARVR